MVSSNQRGLLHYFKDNQSEANKNISEKHDKTNEIDKKSSNNSNKRVCEHLKQCRDLKQSKFVYLLDSDNENKDVTT